MGLEYLVIFAFIILIFYLGTTGWMERFRYRFALPILLIGFPLFYYFVIYPNFNLFKLGLFLVMLGGFIYNRYGRKIDANQAG